MTTPSSLEYCFGLALRRTVRPSRELALFDFRRPDPRDLAVVVVVVVVVVDGGGVGLALRFLRLSKFVSVVDSSS